MSRLASVVLIGTLDTKGAEYAYLRDRIRELGVEALIVDAGVYEPCGIEPDIGRGELALPAAQLLRRSLPPETGGPRLRRWVREPKRS